MRNPLASLSARLIAVVVLLVMLTTAFIAVATTLAMSDNLEDRLDEDVRQALDRTIENPGRPPGPDTESPGGPGRGSDGFRPGEQVGLITAVFPEDGIAQGLVLNERDRRSFSVAVALTEEQLEALAEIDDDRPTTTRIRGLGSYRVASEEVDGGRIVVGLPREEVDETITSLIRLEILAALVGVAMAAVAGAFVVRRQLLPLREVADTAHRVAELPLAEGEIELHDRVPARLTREDNEVGRVGGALNTLLTHVESSLAARQRSEQRVRQFVADASHELRTPLTTIAGYSELARSRPDDPETTATALAKVEEESARMTALVEDLLLLARLDSGRPLRREPVDLTRLLLEAVGDARVVASEHRWWLDLPDEAITVIGDAERLHQVVTNLLTNARKYTPAGTTVTVSGRAGGFSVHDDGPGFPPEILPTAFERFARADAARTRSGGVGLGLALVRAIVDSHGGGVRLSSVPGDTRIDVALGGPAQ